MSDDDHLHSIIADYGDACAEMQAELSALRTELADAKAVGYRHLDRANKAEDDNAAKNARIASLAATILYWTGEVARLTQNSCDDQDRAERAEAERDAVQKVLHSIWEDPRTASWILELIEGLSPPPD